MKAESTRLGLHVAVSLRDTEISRLGETRLLAKLLAESS